MYILDSTLDAVSYIQRWKHSSIPCNAIYQFQRVFRKSWMFVSTTVMYKNLSTPNEQIYRSSSHRKLLIVESDWWGICVEDLCFCFILQNCRMFDYWMNRRSATQFTMLAIMFCGLVMYVNKMLLVLGSGYWGAGSTWRFLRVRWILQTRWHQLVI